MSSQFCCLYEERLCGKGSACTPLGRKALTGPNWEGTRGPAACPGIGHGVNKLLGVPKLTSGTGENTAAAVYALLQDWSVADRVKAMCFDTTSSNTGHRAGDCILLEQKLKRDLLYLACRHHIMELILAAAFKAVMGVTSGPTVPLFKRFQTGWDSINQSSFRDSTTDESVKVMVQSSRDELLEFFAAQLAITQPRDD